MHCQNCGKENQEDARFCMQCGADLSGYKVEISPNIDVSPKISISTMDREQISLLVDDKLSKALEKVRTFKDIQKKEITPEEQQAASTLQKIVEEAGRRKGGVSFSKYDPHDLERCVKFLDTNCEIFDEEGKEGFLFLKGCILSALCRNSEALVCWDKVLEINPRNYHAWFYKGYIFKALNKYDEADNCFNETLDINPECDEAWAEKGSVRICHLNELTRKLLERRISLEEYRSKNREQEEEARRYIDKALEINRLSEWAWILKSMVEKDTNEQIRCVDKALDINPRSADALCQKGVVKYISALKLVNFDGRIKGEKLPEFKSWLWESIEFYDKALKIEPNHAQAIKERKKLSKELKKLQ